MAMKAYNVVEGSLVGVVSFGETTDMTASGLEIAYPYGDVYRWWSGSQAWRMLQRSLPKNREVLGYHAQLLPLEEHQVPEVVRLAHMVT